MTTFGVCVACATPPVDKSLPSYLVEPRCDISTWLAMRHLNLALTRLRIGSDWAPVTSAFGPTAADRTVGLDAAKRTTGTSQQVNFLSNVLLKSCAQRSRFTPEQTANLQTALLHLDGVRAQMPTAQQGSIHS